MQSFKALSRSLCKTRFLSHYRSLCSHTIPLDGSQNLILVESKASSRTVILNRPQVLNALNTPMGARLKNLYKSWEKDPHAGFVVMKGNGKAFCAGGDVLNVYQLINEGRVEDCKEFFRTIYSFIYLVGTYLKPHVAILDGITMGGGGGISVPGTFRVATDRTIFATPEILIGHHPDGGASYHLSHLPGYLGEYLALTGDRLSGVEMLVCGLATHYSSTTSLPLIEEYLGTLVTDDPSIIGTILAKYSDLAYPDTRSVLHRIEMIDKCFGHDTVEEIINALESEASQSNDQWCISTLKKLREAPPLSLKVSLRSIREGRWQTLEQCLVREYWITLQVVSRQISNDFCEGVRARLVDKSFSPKWNPPRLEQVTEDMVDRYFSPLSVSEPELELPIKQQEAFA